MSLRLVPPLRDPFLRIRSVPCSMRFTGQPRLIPDVDSMRCETKSSGRMSCGAREWRCSAMNSFQPGDGEVGVDTAWCR